MVSLKMTTAEARAEGYGSPADVKPPEYPWGTALTLTDEAVKALFPGGLPKVGQEYDIAGRVCVKATREDERQGGEARLSVELQMTDLDIPNAGTDKPSAATTIYGEAGPRQSQD